MNWIWLSEKRYPDFQRNFVNINETPAEKRGEYKYCVAEFKKTADFGKKIVSVKATVSADSFYHFYLNGRMLSIGPASSGGDFLCRRPAPKHYANEFELPVDSDSAEILVRVRLLPEVLTDYSRRHGGLAAELVFTLEDGTQQKIVTDESWLCRADTAYDGFQSYNSALAENEWTNAVNADDVWNVGTAPIPVLTLNTVLSEDIIVSGKYENTFVLPKIYGAYPVLRANGKCRITLVTRELPEQQEMTENIIFGKAGEYISFRQHSIGEVDVTVECDKKTNIHFELIAPWYPVGREGRFVTSDEGLNKIYDICKHTLKICRQSLHLDSTKHQEHLACTGDYYIESLMTLYCFDDFRLSEFDIMRTADWLVDNRGRMFHTTYSLIWVQMLKDVYMITGNKSVLEYSRRALDILLDRFAGYIGDSGVIEMPPDFMFVDWTVIDGYTMHHPPKALGQTVLNAFYYEALNRAAEIYGFLGDKEKSAECTEKAKKFYLDFNREFYDENRRLYFDGKNGEYGGDDPNHLPANSDKRYFSKYPNIIVCAYGLTDDDSARDILERIIFDGTMQDIQPYFAHYLLKAVRRLGLFGKYGMKIISRWKKVVEDCDKGLAEGWIAPQPDYKFDHSHAWGGTPAYNLPSVISGLKILEPGMKKISFTPELWGLDFAEITIPSPLGNIELIINKDGYTVTAPDETVIVS